MGFKEVNSLDADVTVAIGGRNKKTNKENPTSAEGYYLGSKKVASAKSKTGFAYIHILQTPKGNLGVWGKADMDRKVTTVMPGTMIRITHTGMQPTPNGDMYKFKIEQDDSNTIDVGGLAAVATDYSAEDSGTADEVGLTQEDQAELLAAQAEAEARAKKVQDLLNKTKKRA